MSAGRRIAVTGASRGIGRAVATALLARGDAVALIARDEQALAAVAAGASQRAHCLPADLAAPGQAEAAVERAAQALGGLDALVCCAGIVHYQFVGALSHAALAAQLAVNYLAPVLASQRAAALMGPGGGSIVHLASTLGLHPAPGTLGYAAAKAALLSAVKTLAAELAPRVRVNAIAPGGVDTDMIRVPRLAPGEPAPVGAALTARVAAEVAALQALHPLGRLGTPEEVSAAVLFLLDAPWITGTVLVVDGGLLTR